MTDETEYAINEKAPGKKRKWVLPLVAILCFLSIVSSIVFWLLYDNQKAYIGRLERNAILYSESYFHFDSITVDSFEKKVASGEEFIVFITHPNCSACHRMEMPFVDLAYEKGINDRIYHLNVAVLRRNNDDWAEFKETYEFDGTPTYLRFAGGKQVSRVGYTREDGIEFEMVKNWIEEQGDFFAGKGDAE